MVGVRGSPMKGKLIRKVWVGWGEAGATLLALNGRDATPSDVPKSASIGLG